MDKIIHAEDEEALRELFMLGVAPNFPGMEIVQVESGKALEEALNNGIEGLRMVFTDNSMPPGPTGLEVIERYARAPGFENIPFVLYSAHGENANGAMRSGAYAFLPKPVSLKNMSDTIRSALDNPTGSSQ